MLSVLLPAYQEAENLSSILPRINSALADVEHEILIVDTMTPLDNTEEICRENSAIYLPRTGGNMYGDAIRMGIAKAQGEYIAVMDADGSHDPKEILNFLKCMKSGEYDLIIGSRYCSGGQTDNNAILKLMSWVLNVSYRICFGLFRVKDISDSFRLYKAEQLKSIELECDNFDIVEEILIKLSMRFAPFRIKEVPITFNKRVAGESKRSLVKFIISYLVTMWRLMKIKHNFKKK